jgi:hypothetical protein
MNVSTMMNALGARLEDAKNTTFTTAMKLQALNNAQINVANALVDEYLTELQVSKTPVTFSGGVAAITAAVLGYNVLRGAQGIKKVIVTGGKEATRIDPEDRKKMDNSFYAATLQNPQYYVWEKKIFIFPTTITSAEVWFLKVPSPLRYEFAYAGTSGNDSTSITGAADQGLAATDDYYNGGVIYSDESGKYHVITDYVGTTRVFTLTPVYMGPFVSGSFHFLTHDFDQTNLAGVNTELNEALHDIMVTLAESECWQMDRQTDRLKTSYDKARNDIDLLNARYKRAEGIGTSGSK